MASPFPRVGGRSARLLHAGRAETVRGGPGGGRGDRRRGRDGRRTADGHRRNPARADGGGADARPLDGGGDGGLRTLWTLGDGTNCWWGAEGRDPADADGDGLDNFHEYALGCAPGTPDTNGDGRADGEEAGEGVSPALADADWAAYGTAEFSVRVQGLRAARRAGVSVGHVTHAGVAGRTYALAAGYRYPVTVIDLDPDNTSACSGTVRITHDGATFLHGFTNEFPVSFPLDPAAPACPPGTEMTVAGIDLDIPDITWVSPGGVADFPVAARFVPDGEEIAGTPHWSVSGGGASPASGGMETWVTVTFPETAARAPLDAGAETNSPPAVTVEVGDRKVTRNVYPPPDPDPEDPDPWDGRRFIARSPGDSDPVELTYALVLSTNAVPFAWCGHPGDTVLEWTFTGDGPRFLKDGQEVRTVTRAQSVSVLPKGSIDNFEITAKVLMAQGGTVTRRTELRVVTVVAEPVMSFTPGMPMNPSGFFNGDAVTFKVEFSSNIDETDVRWEFANGKAVIASVSQSTAPQTVVGLEPGTDTLTANIEHYWGPPPQFNFEVYSCDAPIPVHFMFICDNNGSHVGSASEIPDLIDGVNEIYRQAGIRFNLATVAYTNEMFWYLNSDDAFFQEEIVNSRRNTQGLEIYIVPNIATNTPGRNYLDKGLLMTGTDSVHIFAHEIGHECELRDIYTSESNQPPPPILLSPDHLSSSDWNNGPGPQEYYAHGISLATVISRCLMFGSTSGGNDLPTGSVKGYDKNGVFGPVPVGTQGMDRFPSHSN
ncbi:MAG TPA: hypothetical protein PLW27_01380 [Kiritimatiellia bacterium]|nr:MAG: hypothetical protein BWX70_02802 [Verrucomicrobia bacterium ADurb.Bin070]HQA37526.1 hypothetical protein [Kiritimatiellia bacterium]